MPTDNAIEDSDSEDEEEHVATRRKVKKTKKKTLPLPKDQRILSRQRSVLLTHELIQERIKSVQAAKEAEKASKKKLGANKRSTKQPSVGPVAKKARGQRPLPSAYQNQS
jgi:hypothetical protein